MASFAGDYALPTLHYALRTLSRSKKSELVLLLRAGGKQTENELWNIEVFYGFRTVVSSSSCNVTTVALVIENVRGYLSNSPRARAAVLIKDFIHSASPLQIYVPSRLALVRLVMR